MALMSDNQKNEFLNLFEKEFSALSVAFYLITLFKGNERELISLHELSKISGYSRPKLRQILRTLEEKNLIKRDETSRRGINITYSGSFLTYARSIYTHMGKYLPNVGQNLPNVGQNLPSQSDSEPNLEFNIARYNERVSKTFVLQEVERLDLTGTSENSMFIPIPNTYSNSKDLDLDKTKTKTITKSRNPAKNKKPKIRKEPPEEVKELAKIWFDWACSQTPTTKFNLEKFEDAIWAMTKKTQRDIEDIKRLFAFIKSDQKEKGFCYARNFISPTKWNKVWSNDLTALDNAFNSMGKAQSGSWKWAHVPQDKLTDEQIADLF